MYFQKVRTIWNATPRRFLDEEGKEMSRQCQTRDANIQILSFLLSLLKLLISTASTTILLSLLYGWGLESSRQLGIAMRHPCQT
jgi:hypothetical protein